MTVSHDDFAALVLENCRAIKRSAPGWRHTIATTSARRLILDSNQCASLATYFDMLEATADRMIAAATPAAALPENVLQFPTGSRRRPSTTSGGGDAA